VDRGRRRELIALGREALERFLLHGETPRIETSGAADETGDGVFVTLRHRHRLHGCIGLVQPGLDLPAAVRHCAVAAAIDPRFEPLLASELAETSLEISVLGPPRTIKGPDDFEPGAEGLIVALGGRKGLLLPQVACEQRWGAARFLEETCVKAGLPRDSWMTGAKIEAFSAEVFREEDLGSAESTT
jgi:AmmeMemoRadiSam system protein A